MWKLAHVTRYKGVFNLVSSWILVSGAILRVIDADVVLLPINGSDPPGCTTQEQNKMKHV